MSFLGLFDYPSEIRQIRNQLPKNERTSFLNQYKKLPNKSKSDFKKALRQADTETASLILGKDLTMYQMAKRPENKAKNINGSGRPSAIKPSNDNIIDKVNKILAVPTGIDPALVAEAAKRYEEAVPSTTQILTYENTNTQYEG